MASIVRLEVGGLVDIVLIGGDGTKVAGGVRIFSGSARGLVGEFLCQILFANFSSPLRFKGLANMTSYSILTVLVVEFKPLSHYFCHHSLSNIPFKLNPQAY